MEEKQRENKRVSFPFSKKMMVAFSLFLIAFVLSLLARYITGFADAYYTYVYQYISTVLAFVYNLVPFSVAEVSLYVLCFLLLASLIYGIYVLARKRGKRKAYWTRLLGNYFLTFTIIFFLYVAFCGINYQRSSFSTKEDFSKKQYGTEELMTVCEYLTDVVNDLGSKTLSFSGIREASREAMYELSNTYTSLEGYYPKPKYMLFAEFLSFQQVSGIYSFYTIEANYNSDMPLYLQPYTMCHELAHLKGIMREEEANFVAYLACMNSDNVNLQYSGAMMAYSFCMNELYRYDVEAYMKIREKLCEKANEDILSKHTFWKQYEGTISKVQTKLNDAYLKANSQASGVGSYNEVVSLIVNDYISKHS